MEPVSACGSDGVGWLVGWWCCLYARSMLAGGVEGPRESRVLGWCGGDPSIVLVYVML
jgi:hypothetical protein